MTPRSKKYFRQKLFDRKLKNWHLSDFVDWMIKRSQPTPRFPEGIQPSRAAIVGQVGPELLMRPDGSTFMTHSRLYPIEKPVEDLILAKKYRDMLLSRPIKPPFERQGFWDVTITNAFTPFAKMTIKPAE